MSVWFASATQSEQTGLPAKSDQVETDLAIEFLLEHVLEKLTDIFDQGKLRRIDLAQFGVSRAMANRELRRERFSSA
ncbi:hypothetical protein RZS28_04570 [Methylocapsa polymorpha]|uniref:Uncharacterized protein n=1 Tax=Methylocapsa polymorpha TaxID=3080828 RepID=A0ABZ0HUV5_9HYPH|nr:hypothetical protein RZS28_04570 [Methylocapsa sp. RX1]